MTDLLIDPGSSPPMVEVWIWIGHYADGTEGMLSADIPMDIGITRHMPLMSSRLEVAAAAGDMARRIQSSSQHASRRIVRVELRRFRAAVE